MHRPIMVAEVLDALRPSPGEIVVDCTLGGGGHARALLERMQPGGFLLGLDIDPVELPRTRDALRGEGRGVDVFDARLANFRDLRGVLDEAGIAAADAILADLGVSAMQHDDPARGFHYKKPGPLDMRMDPARGEPAAALLERATAADLERVLTEFADEPHAALIAALITRQGIATTNALERLVRTGLAAAQPDLPRSAVKASVRRTFQALRIAVNQELEALDALLAALPACLAPGGRAVFLTFHSGEDRRVKKAFQQGARQGLYAEISTRVVRSRVDETRANRRAMSAKLRWAVRART